MGSGIIDGRAAAQRLRDTLRLRVQDLAAAGVVPGLTVLLVGEDPASRVYVGNKEKASREIGIASRVFRLAADIDQASLLAQIARLNADPLVHGILVQLPLPSHIDSRRVLEAIDPEKDVDGFHPVNAGRLATGNPRFVPCTPAGVMYLLREEQVLLWGRHAVIVGASNIVGKPMAFLLLREGATITVCNSKTPDLGAHTRQADLVVVATGKPGIVDGGMLKPGVTVIDVGTNRLADGRLVGDVDFASAREVAGKITPVPGGVGPMTVAMLLANTVQAAEWSAAQQPAVAA